MEQTHDMNWEISLEQMARRFEYPATPDVAAVIGRPTTGDRRQKVHGRSSAIGGRLAWAMVILVLVAAALVAVPQTRAALLSLFARVGAIEIFIDDAEPTPVPAPSPTADPNAPATHSLSLFDLGQPVTLAAAREATSLPLLPPPTLGEPGEVYIHDRVSVGDEDAAVTMVWRDEGGAPLSLTVTGETLFAMKLVASEDVKALRVGDAAAVWLEGPHRLRLLGQWMEDDLDISSNVLIWAVDGNTYRLEGDLPEAEMLALAESIQSSP